MDRPNIPPSPPSPSRRSDSNMLSKTTILSSDGRIMKELETNIESLPDELLFDILVHLPADFLHHKAWLVCHRWCLIIRSNAFISTHIEQYSTYGLVLSLPSLCRSEPPHSIYVTATQGLIGTSELSCIRTKDIVATSCDGFALERNAHSIHVINPATKQSFLLPSLAIHDRDVYHDLNVYDEPMGIAFCAASMKYKVTLLYFDFRDRLTCLNIVTVGVDKSWRHVDLPPLPEHIGTVFDMVTPVCSEGFMHWGGGRYCATLNVETEILTVSEVPMPPNVQLYRFEYNYLSTGRYLTVLVRHKKYCWGVWEMRPAESGEWRKVMPDINLESLTCTLLRKPAHDHEDDKYLKPVGWVKYPEVLALCFRRLERTCIF